ncbi:ComF family protein [candidate division TA06 bacterium]|uniref:ComF family protein n=1 Tax=candidate division TA06 bacterium TaxID=2250710 RepID=A0A933MJ03_UNCT6|nr:ComF family protein [candidate division TA06 bacterium]
MLKSLFHSLLNFIFPPFCASCHKNMLQQKSGLICDTCWDSLERWEAQSCQRCGMQVPSVSEDQAPLLCPKCRVPDWACADIRVIGPFKAPLADAIHLLKYSDRRSVVKKFSGYMEQLLAGAGHYQTADLILAVPLHPARKRERGYNQAQLLAQALGKLLNKPCPEKIIFRARHNRTQTKLNKQQRLENVRDIFTVKKPELVKGKRIILIDDVLTTGATIGSCASSLLAAGASQVLALTAAAAPLD